MTFSAPGVPAAEEADEELYVQGRRHAVICCAQPLSCTRLEQVLCRVEWRANGVLRQSFDTALRVLQVLFTRTLFTAAESARRCCGHSAILSRSASQVALCRFADPALDTVIAILQQGMLCTHSWRGETNNTPLPRHCQAMHSLPQGLLLTVCPFALPQHRRVPARYPLLRMCSCGTLSAFC